MRPQSVSLAVSSQQPASTVYFTNFSFAVLPSKRKIAIFLCGEFRDVNVLDVRADVLAEREECSD